MPASGSSCCARQARPPPPPPRRPGSCGSCRRSRSARSPSAGRRGASSPTTLKSVTSPWITWVRSDGASRCMAASCTAIARSTRSRRAGSADVPEQAVDDRRGHGAGPTAARGRPPGGRTRPGRPPPRLRSCPSAAKRSVRSAARSAAGRPPRWSCARRTARRRLGLDDLAALTGDQWQRRRERQPAPATWCMAAFCITARRGRNAGWRCEARFARRRAPVIR